MLSEQCYLVLSTKLRGNSRKGVRPPRQGGVRTLESPELPITYMRKHKGEEGQEAIPPT